MEGIRKVILTHTGRDGQSLLLPTATLDLTALDEHVLHPDSVAAFVEWWFGRTRVLPGGPECCREHPSGPGLIHDSIIWINSFGIYWL